MKKLLIGLLALGSLSVFASEKEVLTCSNDAIDVVRFVENTETGNKIEIHYLSGENADTYSVKRSFKYIKKDDSDTFVGESKMSANFGGTLTDAILVRVFKGAKQARLALNGSVLYLNCHK